MLFSQMEFFRGRGNRLCGGDKGAMKTDEVCGRPLDPFGALRSRKSLGEESGKV